MTSNQPTVSIIIPALDAADTLPTALQSIARQSYRNIVDVVVAAGDDDTADAVGGQATVIRNPSRKTSTALNLAFAESIGKVVVRCDAHAQLPPDYVSAAVETLRRTGADVVGGMQVPVGHTVWERAIASAMSSTLGAGDARYRTDGEEGPVETVYLGVFRREAIERVGGFDDDFIRNQDYELNHRIIQSGGIVWFNPAMRVEYKPRSSLAALARQYFEYGRAKRQFSAKHPGSLRWRQLAPPILVVGLGAALLASLRWSIALLVVLLYGGSMLVAGLASGSDAWRTALALMTMHLSWGSGFLFGTLRS